MDEVAEVTKPRLVFGDPASIRTVHGACCDDASIERRCRGCGKCLCWKHAWYPEGDAVCGGCDAAYADGRLSFDEDGKPQWNDWRM